MLLSASSTLSVPSYILVSRPGAYAVTLRFVMTPSTCFVIVPVMSKLLPV